ncbi:MAG: UbiX family flavin prenyltransferase [Thermoplasmatota archaeon]
MVFKDVIVALSGASGAGYGLEVLRGASSSLIGKAKLYLVYNDTSLKIMEDETGVSRDKLGELASEAVHSSRMDHPLASGSNDFGVMIICPCSTSTAAKIHAGIADNLITRCAAVALKERRRLILVVRESPLSTPVLRSLYELSSWGVVIMPASPPFYNLGTESIRDLQKGFAGRVLASAGIRDDLKVRYEP